MKDHLANFTTLLNLLCGIGSVWFLLHGKPDWACYAIIAGAAFDFIDGFVARALKISSELGKQLDSLSDIVTFGVAPTLLFASMLEKNFLEESDWFRLAIVSPLFINALFAGLRLAKFNLDTRQSFNFIGLPVPSNAMFFVSLSWLIQHNEMVAQLMSQHFYFYYLLSFLFCYFMISKLPLFGLKFKQYQWKGNEPKIIFLLSCILIAAILGVGGLSLCIVLYILTSVAAKKYFL